MSIWNEAKQDTLQCVYQYEFVTASDLAHLREISLHSASNRLRRAQKQGLLIREKNGKEYVYSIQEKGINRLIWLIREREALLNINVFSNPSKAPSRVDKERVAYGSRFNKISKMDRCKVIREVDDDSSSSDVDAYDETLDVFKNVKRCEVERPETIEDIEDLFTRLTRERCKVN